MPFYEKGAVRIHYQEAGAGYPLLVIPGGGLNATLSFLTGAAPFNPMARFTDEYRCIAADLRNAKDGQSSGPLETDRPWDAFGSSPRCWPSRAARVLSIATSSSRTT